MMYTESCLIHSYGQARPAAACCPVSLFASAAAAVLIVMKKVVADAQRDDLHDGAYKSKFIRRRVCCQQ
jgi:hypothetical protein